jgi:hypothetical protein
MEEWTLMRVADPAFGPMTMICMVRDGKKFQVNLWFIERMD